MFYKWEYVQSIISDQMMCSQLEVPR